MATASPSSRRLPPCWRALALPAALLGAWGIAARLAVVDPKLLPSPRTVLETSGELLAGRELWVALAASLGRTLAGFAIAATSGVAAGTLLGVSRVAERLVLPTFHAWRQIAVFAWIPLISAWFGTGDACKVAFIAIAGTSPVLFNTFGGVRALAPEHRELARILDLGRARFLVDVVVPGAMPQILAGLQLAIVTTWLASFGSELFLQVSAGVGNVLVEGRALGRMDLVLFGIAVVGAVGFGLSTAVQLVERRVLRWRTPHPNLDR
jgi:sulfonate transport system permease protein